MLAGSFRLNELRLNLDKPAIILSSFKGISLGKPLNSSFVVILLNILGGQGQGWGSFFFFPLFFKPIKVRCTQTHTHGKSHKGPGPGLGAWGPQPQITGTG